MLEGLISPYFCYSKIVLSKLLLKQGNLVGDATRCNFFFINIVFCPFVEVKANKSY